MAALRLATQRPIGSAQWIIQERDQAQAFVDQEVEEFTFAMQNELTWLNEHMDELFTQEQLNVPELFKTPGKLRGKTPRTARRPADNRMALSEVFTNKVASPIPDKDIEMPKTNRKTSTQRLFEKIRMLGDSQRMSTSRATLSSKEIEKSAPAAGQTTAGASTSSKPKALIVAAKKKEQEELEALQKAEQKLEIERKRTAQKEEAERQRATLAKEEAERREAAQREELAKLREVEEIKELERRRAQEKEAAQKQCEAEEREMERQRAAERKEAEKQRQIEVESQRRLEEERQREIEAERQRELHAEKLRDIEAQKQREQEAEQRRQEAEKRETERLRRLEEDKQRELEAEKQREAEAESQKRREVELEKQRQWDWEAERQRELIIETRRKVAEAHEAERKRKEQINGLRAEERQAAIENAKKVVPRAAVEKRRLEEAKKALESKKGESQRPPAIPTLTRMGSGLTQSVQKEKPQPAQSSHRSDLPTARTLTRMNLLQDYNRLTNTVPHINPAKPPKRTLQQETAEDNIQRGTASKSGPSYQQTEAKRRRTNDQEAEETETRPRLTANWQSSVKKESQNGQGSSQSSSFSSNVTGASLSKSRMATISQVPSGPPFMQAESTSTSPPQELSQSQGNSEPTVSKYATSQTHGAAAAPSIKAIPRPVDQNLATGSSSFKAINTPAASGSLSLKSAKASQYMRPSATAGSNVPSQIPSSQKTPGRQPLLTKTAAASPQPSNGDNISLPDIASDSEDDDSDFIPPNWAQSPNLRDLLVQQQLVNPEEVFGPIAPLHMEDIFRNEARHHRFRNRTSSANWSGNDRLTEDDIRKDLAARERLYRDGGWTYGM
ncbi:hypothetical protein L228DRAFT_265667 [Xylona heveae TC161]|uniref:Inner centromere protein ARK-binding domain-containing protein n=1 Tax=Xylona heveae (strain CBS 132557 / TC161) TaxID=1328760 RepID=A0A165IPH7_XYLHT|nr:hypothetical protein L228DRAFT_265667 [Xylona heveae TC161]KZF25192.1 hypothetical protein L228DRAFT_265667 [Xylona heveae TC161]